MTPARPISQFSASPWSDHEIRKSHRWAIMKKIEVPNFDDPTVNYMTRLRIIQTPLFGIWLHRFDSPDARNTFHDHPASFLSVVLRGGYDEVRPGRPLKSVRRFNWVKAEDAHYIEALHRTPTWTLLFVGRRRRNWGYVRPTDEGYSWTRFDLDRHAEEYDIAMKNREAAR